MPIYWLWLFISFFIIITIYMMLNYFITIHLYKINFKLSIKPFNYKIWKW